LLSLDEALEAKAKRIALKGALEIDHPLFALLACNTLLLFSLGKPDNLRFIAESGDLKYLYKRIVNIKGMNLGLILKEVFSTMSSEEILHDRANKLVLLLMLKQPTLTRFALEVIHMKRLYGVDEELNARIHEIIPVDIAQKLNSNQSNAPTANVRISLIAIFPSLLVVALSFAYVFLRWKLKTMRFQVPSEMKNAVIRKRVAAWGSFMALNWLHYAWLRRVEEQPPMLYQKNPNLVLLHSLDIIPFILFTMVWKNARFVWVPYMLTKLAEPMLTTLLNRKKAMERALSQKL
jgi:hypothetical protein